MQTSDSVYILTGPRVRPKQSLEAIKPNDKLGTKCVAIVDSSTETFYALRDTEKY